MKTFISAVFLMLAAYASAQEFEPYEQHVTSAKGAEEMQLFGALDEIVAVYKGDKDGKEKDHKSKDKKEHKDDKKGHKDDKSKHHKDDKSKHHKNRDNSDSSSKSDKSTHRSSSSSSRSKRNYSSKSSSSSSRSSSSSSSSSKSRKNGRSKKYKNRSDLHEGICDCKMKDRDEKFCDDAWDELCKPSARPDTTEYDFCDDFLGIYDCTSQFSSFDGHGRTNLRGNVAEE